MQAGILYGYAGLVDGIVERMKQELGADAKVVATGGLAELVAPETKTIAEVRPTLHSRGSGYCMRETTDISRSYRPRFMT